MGLECQAQEETRSRPPISASFSYQRQMLAFGYI